MKLYLIWKKPELSYWLFKGMPMPNIDGVRTWFIAIASL